MIRKLLWGFRRIGNSWASVFCSVAILQPMPSIPSLSQKVRGRRHDSNEQSLVGVYVCSGCSVRMGSIYR